MAKPSYKYIAETARFAIANIRAICTVDGSTRTDSAAGKAEESARRLTYIAQALEGYDCAQHIADYAESYSYAYAKILQAQEAACLKRKVDLYLEAASMTYNEMVRCNDIELGLFSPADLLRAAAILHDNEIRKDRDMLAEEAHYMGEPCWHVCQYYERKRQARFRENMARLERGKPRAPAFALLPHQEAVARHITGVWTDEAERLPVSWPCFECHNRYGHKATCSKYHEALRRI